MIDKAPTIPRERTTFDVIVSRISVVITFIARSETQNAREKSTPRYDIL